jgi:hypothetical protein
VPLGLAAPPAHCRGEELVVNLGPHDRSSHM